MIYRTYLNKDVTIVKNSLVNTGLNPILRLVYGGESKITSMMLLSFDVSNLRKKKTDKIITTPLTHRLRLYNALSNDMNVLGRFNLTEDEQITSFNLILFKIKEDWSEGNGYAHEYGVEVSTQTKNYSPANYHYRLTGVEWNGGNGIDTSEVIGQPVKFDLGNENLDVDITDFINDLIDNGDGDFYGIGIKLDPIFDDIQTDKQKCVEFYGKDTHTFFEPHIESEWEENVKDDRSTFYLDKENKLYLYVNINREPTNLDRSPEAVIIKDDEDETIKTLTDIKHEGRGVYSVKFEISSSDYPDVDKINFYDSWQGLKYKNKNLKPVEMEFTLLENDIMSLGYETYEPQEFSFSYHGIKKGEKIPNNEIRKVIVSVKEYFMYDEIVVDGLYFDLYIKQGNHKIMVMENQSVCRAFDQNYFYLDTSWMIPQDYYLDLVVHSNGTITRKSGINFSIVDSKLNNDINGI